MGQQSGKAVDTGGSHREELRVVPLENKPRKRKLLYPSGGGGHMSQSFPAPID